LIKIVSDEEQKYPKIFIKTNIDITMVLINQREFYGPAIQTLTQKGLFLGYRAFTNDEIYLVDGKFIEVVFKGENRQ